MRSHEKGSIVMEEEIPGESGIGRPAVNPQGIKTGKVTVLVIFPFDRDLFIGGIFLFFCFLSLSEKWGKC
jgi:hypothetical protein